MSNTVPKDDLFYLSLQGPLLADKISDEIRRWVHAPIGVLDEVMAQNYWTIFAYQAWDEGSAQLEEGIAEEGVPLRPEASSLRVVISFNERTVAEAGFLLEGGCIRICWSHLTSTASTSGGFGGILCEMAERVTRRALRSSFIACQLTERFWAEWEIRKVHLLYQELLSSQPRPCRN